MCVFCKIVKGEIPAFKVYENDNILAFLDISQTTKGHTLVIPKNHVENVFSLSKEDADGVMEGVVCVSNKLKDTLGIENVNLVNNSGGLAGQSVMHFHMHIIPRTENDQFSINQPAYEPNFDELKILCEKINKK